MSLLLDEDYEILKDSGLEYIEDEPNRILIITNFPLQAGFYVSNGEAITHVEVLVIIPGNYNTSGNDMLWTHPILNRSDGGSMPAVNKYGDNDNRFINDKEYCRWSRHYADTTWKSKVDNIQKILSRIEWALRYPEAVK